MLEHSPRQKGFSLVEMLVALIFTMILMAGMATVFKSSLSTFVVSGESISSTRRNRLAMDLLSDDLNLAGQYLDLRALPGGLSSNNPGFWVNPHQAFKDTDIPATDAFTDELMFYFDEPLAGEAKFEVDNAVQAIQVAKGISNDPTRLITFKKSADADAVKPGMYILTRNNYERQIITAAEPVAGSPGSLEITTQYSFQYGHPAGSALLVYRPAQYVRYRIENRNWDPEKPTGIGIPCLIREQGDYPGGGVFTATSTTVVAENVSRFTVAMSVDGGSNWRSGTSWDEILALLDVDLKTYGAPGYTSIASSTHWFRYVPMLVRVDVTTRTAVKRAEFSPAGDALAYKEQTQSLVLLPRHFGLNF